MMRVLGVTRVQEMTKTLEMTSLGYAQLLVPSCTSALPQFGCVRDSTPSSWVHMSWLRLASFHLPAKESWWYEQMKNEKWKMKNWFACIFSPVILLTDPTRWFGIMKARADLHEVPIQRQKEGNHFEIHFKQKFSFRPTPSLKHLLNHSVISVKTCPLPFRRIPQISGGFGIFEGGARTQTLQRLPFSESRALRNARGMRIF